ncbi:alpha/beta fold hydrolase [Thalassobacillus pellis]|uniref:intracellular short-chain-length polyhydroxyalkanoate depolymerase n=1 Tax=Thalassobacillus pellis TaxID=748008 RepID=UPI00195FDE1B|nr:alpha/beta hydrolase [Thalassobacillus pellis]MBM7554407.1 pimeloyl-ACP methyl ester carboxylesterase [Thalassobacillus pellis]
MTITLKITLKNKEKLTYKVRPGGASNLLLIHGNMASSEQWDVFMDQLPPAYTVYAVDLRGYGKSTYRTPIQSLGDFSEDLKLWMDELGIKTTHVMGWSNGGGVAMQLAADYPERVEKVVLLASMSTRGYPVYHTDGKRLHTREQMASSPGLETLEQAQKHHNRLFYKAAMDYMLYAHKQPEENSYENYIDAALEQRNIMDVAFAANRFNISNISNGVVNGSGDAGRITAPVLVLWGKNDRITTEEMTNEILLDLEENGVEVTYSLLNAGHAALIDDLKVVKEKVMHFLGPPL